MQSYKAFAVLTFLFVHGSEQASTPASKEYVAAVVEYHRHPDLTRKAVEHNAEQYVKLIKEAGQKHADIVVFPAETLTPSIELALVFPDSIRCEHPSPCLHPQGYDPVLVKISCAAKAAKIYTVINFYVILDCTVHQECEECPKKKVYYFQDNVVFDRSGHIIDRYRMISTEPDLTPSFEKECLGIFETDFGVRFGHIISFEVLFQNPALEILDDTDIRDVIITARWYNELPFLISVSHHLSFAYVNNINLLVADANLVEKRTSGTGIYSGKAGALVSFITGKPTNRVFISKVPKTPGHPLGPTTGPIYGTVEEKNGLILTQDPSFTAPHGCWSQLVQEDSNQAMSMSSGGLSCSFQFKLKSTETNGVTEKYRYRAVAFDGVREADDLTTLTLGTRYCAVVACLNEHLNSCGKRFPNSKPGNTNPFEKLRISAQFPAPKIDNSSSVPNSQAYPSTLLDTLLPLQPKEYMHTKSEDEGVSYIEMSLVNHKASLLGFGVWERNFDRDGEEVERKK